MANSVENIELLVYLHGGICIVSYNLRSFFCFLGLLE